MLEYTSHTVDQKILRARRSTGVASSRACFVDRQRRQAKAPVATHRNYRGVCRRETTAAASSRPYPRTGTRGGAGVRGLPHQRVPAHRQRPGDHLARAAPSMPTSAATPRVLIRSPPRRTSPSSRTRSSCRKPTEAGAALRTGKTPRATTPQASHPACSRRSTARPRP